MATVRIVNLYRPGDHKRGEKLVTVGSFDWSTKAATKREARQAARRKFPRSDVHSIGRVWL